MTILVTLIVAVALVGGIGLTQQDSPLDKLLGILLVIIAAAIALVFLIL